MTKHEWHTEEDFYDFAERVLSTHTGPTDSTPYCSYCDKKWPCEPRRLAEGVVFGVQWKRFDEHDEGTHPDESKTYVTIDGDDMMQVLAGKLNYFQRAGIKFALPIPEVPEAEDA